MERIAWRVLSALAAVVAAWAAREAAERIWAGVSDGEVPNNPDDPAVPWGQAIGWALLVGTAAGVARVVARKGASSAWRSVTGDEPPIA